MSDAELPDECVDCAYLHVRPAAQISEPCSGNVVFAVWLNQCE